MNEGQPATEWAHAVAKATEVGTRHGNAAVDLYKITDAETAHRLLGTQEDSAPPEDEIYENYTPEKLMQEIGKPEGYDTEDGSLWEAYNDAYCGALGDGVEGAAKRFLRG